MLLRECKLQIDNHSIKEDKYMWAIEKLINNLRKEIIVPDYMVMRKEVDNEYVSLLCSTQVGNPLVNIVVSIVKYLR